MSATGITPDALALATGNLLRWIAAEPRVYAQTMEAWRSSCPRLSVWEDALLDGLVEIVPGAGVMSDARIHLTARGRAVLAAG
ncbi:hypothetical protein [Sediminicoccus sp. KRV36]|uniref:hypothetical protein n=1 Tax=Sediminicoccus sp. KRV36 TaxID=3133721 RepID=UPI0020109714|nr:hypothetical protein [Sediminicoccus rosea]UPY35694.1 hypothetical protein LHU95_15865 [Sediminicoccus rosea]